MTAESITEQAKKGRQGWLRWGLIVTFLALIAFASGVVRPVAAEPSFPLPQASNARLMGDASAVRFEADLTYAIPFNVYVVTDPYRVVIDMPAVDFRFGAGAGRKGRGLVRAYRYGRIAANKARIVLDVTGPVLIRRSWVHHATADRPARMGVELVRTTPETFARLYGKKNDAGAREQKADGKHETGGTAGSGEASGMARAFRHLVEEALRWRSAEPANAAAPSDMTELLADEPIMPGRPKAVGMEKGQERQADDGDTTLARNAPLPRTRPVRATGDVPAGHKSASRRKRPLVVIDPGHGGKDPGAIGWKGVREKDIVLKFAHDLRRMLERAGYAVRMTRSTDRFLTLAQRVAFARRHDAHLFISIHADKFRTGAARGLAVYTLSERASDAEAAELARSENAADIIDGVDLGAELESVRDILIDLALRETKNQSVHFAHLLTRAVRPAARLRPRPVRSANFRVLRNPEVPAVLVELGYVSNPGDVRNMQSAAWRRRVAAALARAVDRYFRLHLAWQDR